MICNLVNASIAQGPRFLQKDTVAQEDSLTCLGLYCEFL